MMADNQVETVVCTCEICRKEFRVERAILTGGPRGTLTNEFVYDGTVLMPSGQAVSIELATAVRLKSGDMCEECAGEMIKMFCDIVRNSPARRITECKNLL